MAALMRSTRRAPRSNMNEILEVIEQQSKFARQQTELGAAALAAQAKIEEFANSFPRS